MNWICIGFGAILLICFITGCVRGMFKVLLTVAGTIASLLVAFYLAPNVSGYVEEHTKLDEQIATYISEEMHFSDGTREITKAVQVEVIQELPISEGLKSNILDNNNSEMYEALEVTDVYDYIAKSISVVLINATVFVVLVIVSNVFFWGLEKLAKDFTKLPIVHSLDKIGGGILGMVQGLIVLWVIFMILSITSTTSFSQEIISSINQFPPFKLLYDNNLILDIVGDLTRVLFL